MSVIFLQKKPDCKKGKIAFNVFTGPSDDRIPENIKGLPENKRSQWVNIWNLVFRSCIQDGGSSGTCESNAFRNANGVVLRDNDGLEGNMFIVNTIAKTFTRQVGTQEFLVAPVILVKEGVLNGELIPVEEIAKHHAAWNGAPFVLDHPTTDDGAHVSANAPDILADVLLGRVFNTHMDGPALKGEVWIDAKEAQNKKRGKEVVEKLIGGIPLEVSTAYFRDREEKQGTHEGIDFEGIARNLKPDHLAVLLDVEGACSWADGCGIPRVNKNDDDDDDEEVDVAPELKVQKKGDEELIGRITTDGRLGLRKEELEKLPTSVLSGVADFLDSKEDVQSQEDDDDEDKDKDKNEEEEVQEPAVNIGAPCPELQALATAVKERGGVNSIMALLDGIQANEDGQKETVISSLVANEACAFDNAHLKAMDLNDLVLLHKSLSPADYSPQGGGNRASSSVEVDAEIPPMFSVR